jgi:anti-sigma factor RsiW
MSTKHVLDELSAYIDGAAKRPESIERHLRTCESCARRHMELLKLRSHVAGLRGPVARTGFEARVLARIDEAESPRSFPWRLVASVAGVVLVTAVALLVWQPWAPPSPERIVAESRALYGSEDQARAALEALAAAEPGSDYLAEGVFIEEEEALPEVSVEEVLLYLAEAASDDVQDAPAPLPDGNAIEALPDEELDLLESALDSYLYGG